MRAYAKALRAIVNTRNSFSHKKNAVPNLHFGDSYSVTTVRPIYSNVAPVTQQFRNGRVVGNPDITQFRDYYSHAPPPKPLEGVG